jgi:hypothetical protein
VGERDGEEEYYLRVIKFACSDRINCFETLS